MRCLSLRITLATFVFFCCVRVAEGQSQTPGTADSTRSESDYSSPKFASGVTVGAMSFTSGRTQQAMSLFLQFQPVAWLSFSAAPGFGRTTFGTTTSKGLTDIPLATSAEYWADDLPWSPSLIGSVSTVLATGQTGSTLGIGRTSFVGAAGLSVSPAAHTYLSGDLSRSVTTASGNGSADIWISRPFGGATPSLGYSAEIGTADSAATLARSVAGGVTFSVAAPIRLAFDGSHGLTSGAPKWTFSVSLGTAFGGISPMSGGSVFGRLKNAFGSRATSSSGYSKTSGSCRKLGTC